MAPGAASCVGGLDALGQLGSGVEEEAAGGRLLGELEADVAAVAPTAPACHALETETERTAGGKCSSTDWCAFHATGVT